MAEKIRVLTIISGLAIGEPLGGAERFGIELARSLNRDKFEPIVCAFWRRGVPSEHYWVDYLAKVGVEVFFAMDRGGGFNPSRYMEGLWNIGSYLQDRPVDVIHSHFQLGSVTALLLKRRLGAKALIRTAHGSVRWEWSNTLYGFLCRQVFTKWIFPLGYDAEAGVSQAVVSSLNQRPGVQITGKKALLIYNGICPERFRVDINQSKRLELGLSQDDLVVGSVGRLSEQKGYAFLIEAALHALAELPNIKFVIIGDGELRASLELKVRQLGLSNTVIFTGPRQEVESLFRVMDLFVLPSLWEGLPTVILESMASGVPVVATDIPGTRELVQAGQTGWLVRHKDSAGLAKAIVEALRDPLKRADIANRALDTVVARYSMARIANQYETLYHNVTGHLA